MPTALVEDRVLESEAREPEMAITVGILEERVNGHIKFVWTLMGVGFTWLAGISIVLYQMNGTMNRVEKAQVDAPARIITGLLKRTPHTRDPLAKLGTKWGWRVLAGVGCPVFWRTNCLLRSSIVGPAYPHTIYWGLKIDTFPGSACLCKVLCAFSSIPPV